MSLHENNLDKGTKIPVDVFSMMHDLKNLQSKGLIMSSLFSDRNFRRRLSLANQMRVFCLKSGEHIEIKVIHNSILNMMSSLWFALYLTCLFPGERGK